MRKKGQAKPSLIFILPVVLVLMFSSIVCSLSPDLNQAATEAFAQVQPTVEALQKTLEAMATSAPTIIIDGSGGSPSGENGEIRGSLSYPSEFIPPMRVVAFKVENGQMTGEYHYVDTLQNAPDYSLQAPPGVYWVVSYPMGDLGQDPTLAGGYTQSVPCGLTAECSDHSFIDVTIQAGQTVTGVDPADWYAPDDAFPTNPEP